MLTPLTKDELAALMPKHEKRPLDQTFYRDLVNHWSMFGVANLVKKMGRGWIVNFCDYGHPVIYKTKREAMNMADAWVLSVSHEGLNKAV